MLKRFFAWIGDLMRHRPFFAKWGYGPAATVVVPPPPPPPPGPPPPPPPPPPTVGQLVFNQTAQSGLLLLLEEM